MFLEIGFDNNRWRTQQIRLLVIWKLATAADTLLKQLSGLDG